MTSQLPAVHIVSLGCARNEVDSEELAGRLAVGGFSLVDDPSDAEVVVVNTCGFIDAAKKDSIDTLLAAADLKDEGTVRSVVAVGCLAERYGAELARELPEADAVLGFDDYADISVRLRGILAGETRPAHAPRDRRTLLPLTPVARPAAARGLSVPGHADLPAGLAPASGPPVLRRRLDGSPTAPLKIASGCDRRCAFCAIPSFRGSYLSRPVDEVVAEAGWLAGQGVREVMLVSENSSSYGKDLVGAGGLESLLEALNAVDGLDWVRVSYLQPAELRPSLIEAICGLDKVVPYFDLPFQHASATVLRRMRRFGDAASFLGLLGSIRTREPLAGVRSNVIVGFPGETEEDIEILTDFLVQARLDAVGVFGYSDEEGTEGARLDGKLPAAEIADRVEHLAALVDEITRQRAEDRLGERVRVLLEEPGERREWTGRAAHQGPEADTTTTVSGLVDGRPGQLVWGRVVAVDGMDLIAEAEL
ncbi:MAG: 30S ribosomal protein S12 methylthiotransferase RimO [Propionicimonas sp.]|nr:30S ribosomal protein S12 methylthiotransferase RimO [Propionicimonas sp.]